MGIGTLRRHYTKPKADPVAEEAPTPAVDVPNQEAPPVDAQTSSGGVPDDLDVSADSSADDIEDSTEAQTSLPVQAQQPQQQYRGSRRHR